MTDPAHDAAREWVGEQLRYPQRLPRTVVVLDWNSVPHSVQRGLEEVARVSRSIDDTQLPLRRWWRGNAPGLSTGELRVVESAASELRWPTSIDNNETRLLAIVEGVVDRVAEHPAWQHPVLTGYRSVVALHMELHAFAIAAHELLQLRYSTPEVPADAALESCVRQEWDRRQVAFAHSRVALIERAVALRLIELALDRVHRLAEDFRITQQLAAQSTAIDDLYRRLAGADVAGSTTHTTVHELEAAAENLRAQLAYLSIGQV